MYVSVRSGVCKCIGHNELLAFCAGRYILLIRFGNIRLPFDGGPLELDWWFDEFRDKTTSLKCWAGQVTTSKLFVQRRPDGRTIRQHGQEIFFRLLPEFLTCLQEIKLKVDDPFARTKTNL